MEHMEGGGGDHMTVSVLVPNHSGINYPNSIREMQRVYTDLRYKFEVQTILVRDPPNNKKEKCYMLQYGDKMDST